ncbi:Membrane fusion component of tripartite multidrug resistance system [Candidatus Palibaumannia cicadellinicola]|uniref:Membrane fusion component of tripartite multidrug resistance system n=2 Tax=Candidatus Palibaumannia cicadellinicola TaxID=186490 RepID=A0A0K2BKS8_9GAMM|nr:Membrane fusion component of tripartite multidrug resistance system [Candidatus Baumannia cicadellinicola]
MMIIIFFITYSVYYWSYEKFYESTNDAYVTGNLVKITPQLVGTVTMITVDDGDFVKKGQLLVKLDPSDTIIAQESAETKLAKVVRQVCRIHDKINVYKKIVNKRNIELQSARTNYKIRLYMLSKGLISKNELSNYLNKLTYAENLLSSAQQQLDTMIVLADKTTTIAQHPDVQHAAAHVRSAYINHKRSNLFAPVSGFIAKRSVQIGSYIEPGTVLMTIVPLNNIWIEANFKETQLLSMRIGQPVEIKSDLYGNKITYHGKVESIGIGTGSVFALLPAQNASGNWIKIVQRLPIRISINPDNLDRYPLRIGLSTNVKVDLHNQKGPLLAPHKGNNIRYITEIYDNQLSEANKLVSNIIYNNCELSKSPH